jgi:uncharacterized protein YjiK
MKSICYTLLGAACLLWASCAQTQEQNYKSPKRYNLKEGAPYKMPEELLEISGITFHKGNPDTVFAIQDEDGKLYYGKLMEGTMRVRHTKFGKHGDYEDIAICNNRVFILKSNGKIYTFHIDDIKEKELSSVQELTSILPPGEYESMYADEEKRKLYVLCKNCEDEKTTKSSTGYVFDVMPNDSLKQSGTFKIEVKQITDLIDDDKIKFRPSAMAQNTITKVWFLVSAVNEILVITDPQWKVKEVYPLNHKTFLQPEGIAFDKKGNMYISNEGDEISKGTILKFKRF